MSKISRIALASLRNPRLLWFWIGERGDWVSGADPSSIVWFRRRVLKDPNLPVTVKSDGEGILPGFDWRAVNAE